MTLFSPEFELGSLTEIYRGGHNVQRRGREMDLRGGVGGSAVGADCEGGPARIPHSVGQQGHTVRRGEPKGNFK